MGKTLEFENVKIGDPIYRKVSGFGENHSLGEVVHVTKTRFKVKYSSQFEEEYTKDGRKYPRETGYIRTYARINIATSENMQTVFKYEQLYKAKSNLNSLERNPFTLDAMSLEDIQKLLDLSTQLVELKNKYSVVERGG